MQSASSSYNFFFCKLGFKNLNGGKRRTKPPGSTTIKNSCMFLQVLHISLITSTPINIRCTLIRCSRVPCSRNRPRKRSVVAGQGSINMCGLYIWKWSRQGVCLRRVRRASVYLTRLVGKASYSCGSGEGMKFRGGMESVIERRFRRI